MYMENALCKTFRLKEWEAEYHGVGCYTENGTVQVGIDYHFIHKHGVDIDTNHDEKVLYAQCKQAFYLTSSL